MMFSLSTVSVFQEGPHSTLKEEEFYDAIDQSLDRIDRETEDFQRTVSHLYFYTFITHRNATIENDCMTVRIGEKKRESYILHFISFSFWQ